MSAWLDMVRADDELLSRLLLAIRSEHVSKRGRYYRINPAWLEGRIKREALADDVRRFLAGSPTVEVRATGEQFLRELKILEEGRNPDDLFDQDWVSD